MSSGQIAKSAALEASSRKNSLGRLYSRKTVPEAVRRSREPLAPKGFVCGERTGHILVVDDEPDFCHGTAEILKKAGYMTSEALSGEEAFMVLVSLKREEYFDLIVLDIQMPGLSGIELMDRLRNREIHIPVIAISDVAERGLIAELMRRNCADFFYKPFKAGELVRRVGFFFYE